MRKSFSDFTTFSWIVLGSTALVILFYSSWFYLGTEETYNELKEERFKNLILRACAFAILGTPSIVLIMIIERFAHKRKKDGYGLLLKKLGLTTCIIVLASILRSVLFF